jgi:DeoR/GlpR family transcriptional regulator of sugar metabolism
MPTEETQAERTVETDAHLSKTERRRSEIMRLLMKNSTAQIKDLANVLQVSLMTIHRDLNDLQELGLVRRLRGTVSAEKSMLFESSYVYRARQHGDEKRRLAHLAIRHIEPGNTIVWDDSSTTYHVCNVIEQVAPVTVITNAFPVMERLRDMRDIQLIALGGKFHRSYNGFFGVACENMIRSYHVDVALISTTTLEGTALYTQDEQVLRVKQAMLSIARKKILMADASKFNFSALNYVADVTAFDVVLLAGDVKAPEVARLRDCGVKVEVV